LPTGTQGEPASIDIDIEYVLFTAAVIKVAVISAVLITFYRTFCIVDQLKVNN